MLFARSALRFFPASEARFGVERGLAASSCQVAFTPKDDTECNRDYKHQAHRPPESLIQVDEGEEFKIHSENCRDQIERHENRGQRGQRAHDVIRAMALCIKVHLDGRLCALLKASHVVYYAFDVFKNIAAADLEQITFAMQLWRRRIGPGFNRLDPVLNG